VTDFFGYGVVTAEWKLLYYPRDDEGRLFHRASDPHDRVNRWRDPSRGSSGNSSRRDDDDEQVTSVMLAALLRWRARQEPTGYARDALAAALKATAISRAPERMGVGPNGRPLGASVALVSGAEGRSSKLARLANMVAQVRGTDAELGLMQDLAGL
jgi:hypothetical protein